MRERKTGAESVSFGPFALFPRKRRLERDGVSVRVGSRALEILIALTDQPGEVVAHRELTQRVWPNIVVDESSLRVHIARLRKALGCDGDGGGDCEKYIANVSGRGYSFVVPTRSLVTCEREDIRITDDLPAQRVARFPTRLIRMLGRDDVIRTLVVQVLERRFVNIVAAGGMGKTSVAVSVAHELAETFNGAIYFVDFGSLTNPLLIANTVASTLGITVQSGDPASSLVATLVHRRALLVLDNCEHLIDAIAPLVERMFVATDQIFLLATSRESMRIQGEHVYRLPPLAVPEAHTKLRAEQALKFPAIQLFVDRATAGGAFDQLRDCDVPTVAKICRNLDGLPLAIELAADRVNAYGLQGTAELLESRISLNWHGRRTALPRHQTLAAMLDWSFRLLCGKERIVLRRLSVFSGPFDIEAIQAVTIATDLSETELSQYLIGLVEKSLLTPIVANGQVSYRLLDTTRAYAASMLLEAGEDDVTSARHARYFTAVLLRTDRIEEEGEVCRISPVLPNIRKALEWSFSGTGDVAIGMRLATAAVPLLLEASLFGECLRWCEMGLACLKDEDRDTTIAMTLLEGQSTSLMFTKGRR